ncbi:phosphoribosylglycinamide formyltransferase [Natribacillus halophilus]|uniref:Phosphoribosylglycinamide formyltransferase n=1 Tax=Natribacillus halophilus TaxID=549003 RepID=A0A1G8P9X2_9BACI|nr:phosphoribosylglycinamide formyltransferase [Natribacillus halophilus]SDI89136.1 formyltetrahydrofolate-dependent phosphoribosylglycinamide formyltransferase [Natribacillus halophilus]
MRLAMFASGTGSNVEAILQAVRSGTLEAEPALVFSDQPEAPVLEKARDYGIDTHTFKPRDFASKQHYEEELLQLLKQYHVDWVALAGYMRLLGPTLVTAYDQRIVNIHPSLLPAFPGLDAIGQALEAEVNETGVTIHYVDDGMDTGAVIRQETVPIAEGDMKDSLAKKVQSVEHRLYPQTLQQLLKDRSEGVHHK